MINKKAVAERIAQVRPVVFEGNAPAAIAENDTLGRLLDQRTKFGYKDGIRIWLGSPVAIKDHTAVLRRQPGSNVLIVGQRADLAMNLMASAIVGTLAQVGSKDIKFVVLDGSPAGSHEARGLRDVVTILQPRYQIASVKQVEDVIAVLVSDAERRGELDQPDPESILVLIYALQRFSTLRRTEDLFGLMPTDQARQAADQQFRQLLQTGPAIGIHFMVWVDTLANLERTIDRQTLREFDWRILFQMGAADSSNLIDSPAANQLGLYRALLYSQEQGTLERFRPYATIDQQWLHHVGQSLSSKPSKNKEIGR